MKNPTNTAIDNVATKEAVRSKYGSIQEFCRQAEVNPDVFYLVLRGLRGHRKKTSAAAKALQRLRDENLLKSA